ncbi:hypothetical protein BJ138DRAFT_1122606 [Hygrophoropsis aurantiaca]|uniref:Uncharacterized protein n=1 Tax=Hygrophoropsis aurantiaca TaxID=72124 RepID=A0ACB8AQM4_9AGAM|nr:hypothetical protein BJ138DRAFT_1122606 [Hygrophoropsis aurantiaca]
MPTLWSSQDVAPSTLDVVDIALILTEGVLYGTSVFMFGLTIYLILRKASSTLPVNFKVVTIAFLFITLTTMHLVLDFIGLEADMLMMQGKGPQLVTLVELNRLSTTVRNFVYVFLNVLGDAVIIYRCHTLWQKYYICVLPFIMWCGVAVFGVLGAIGAGIPGRPTPLILKEGNAEVMVVFFALTLAMNAVTTCLIAYRIWMIERKARTFTDGTFRASLRPVMHIIIDAGMIYSLAILLILCTGSAHQLLWCAWNPIPPVISIMFYMVIIRVKVLPATPQLKSNTTLAKGVKCAFDDADRTETARNNILVLEDARLSQTLTVRSGETQTFGSTSGLP